MKKLPNFLLSLLLFAVLTAPTTSARYVDEDAVPEDCGNECPLITSADDSESDDDSDNDNGADHELNRPDWDPNAPRETVEIDLVTCPDPDAEVTFEGRRAEFMARLKANNPDVYAKVVELIKSRQVRLATLCENHPRIYQFIIRRQMEVHTRIAERRENRSEEREERREERQEKFGANQEKLRLRLCKIRPNAADCQNLDRDEDDSDDDGDETDDSGNDGDEDMDDDHGNDDDSDDSDDDSNEAEVKGSVRSYSDGVLTLSDGTVITLTSVTEVDARGDIISLSGLTAALAAGQDVRAEVDGDYRNGGTVATEVKFEIDN